MSRATSRDRAWMRILYSECTEYSAHYPLISIPLSNIDTVLNRYSACVISAAHNALDHHTTSGLLDSTRCMIQFIVPTQYTCGGGPHGLQTHADSPYLHTRPNGCSLSFFLFPTQQARVHSCRLNKHSSFSRRSAPLTRQSSQTKCRVNSA